MDILFVSYTGYSEDIRRISLGLIRILIRIRLNVDFFRYLFLIRKSFVTKDWNNVEKNKLPTNPKKIVLAFVFREISSIVHKFLSCCELQRCRELPTWIFLLCFSTNRHICRIVRLSGKFQNFLNFANSDFSVFLHESAHLVTFGTILRISEICRAQIFLHISRQNVTFENFGDYFANFENLQIWQTWIFFISQRIGTLSDVWGHFANFRNSR